MKNNVKKIRIEQGLTQTELAISSDVQQSCLSLIERGQRCRPVTAQRIVDVLGVKFNDVFPELTIAKKGD